MTVDCSPTSRWHIMTNNVIRRGKTALREDVRKSLSAKCISMHGEDYSATSTWQKLTKVGTNSITFGGHRELDVRGKKVVYRTYTSSPGRFLEIYGADGSLSALYVLHMEGRAA